MSTSRRSLYVYAALAVVAALAVGVIWWSFDARAAQRTKAAWDDAAKRAADAFVHLSADVDSAKHARLVLDAAMESRGLQADTSQLTAEIDDAQQTLQTFLANNTVFSAQPTDQPLVKVEITSDPSANVQAAAQSASQSGPQSSDVSLSPAQQLLALQSLTPAGQDEPAAQSGGMGEAEGTYSVFYAPAALHPVSVLDTQGLDAWADQLQAASIYLSDSVDAATAACYESALGAAQADADDALSALTEKLAEAEKLYADSADKVADDSTRDALRQAIDEAQKVADAGTGTSLLSVEAAAQAFADAQSQLAQAQGSVESSVSEKAASDAAKAASEVAASSDGSDSDDSWSQGSGSGSGGDGGTWTCEGAGGQWCDGQCVTGLYPGCQLPSTCTCWDGTTWTIAPGQTCAPHDPGSACKGQ